MNISSWIQKKKEEHFLYRDSDKLALQKASLEKERKALQERRNLERDVRKEQQAIKDLRSEPTKNRLAAIRKGFQGLQKASENVTKFSNPNSKSPFAPLNSPFGHDKKSPPPTEKPKARTIVVNIKE